MTRGLVKSVYPHAHHGIGGSATGNIWVTGPGGVWVFSAEGEHLGVVEIPESVGNICFGGPEWKWMFVPASTSLYRFETKVAGNREPFMK